MIAKKNNFDFFRLFFAWLVIVSHSFELLDGNRLREPLTRLTGQMSLGDLAVASFFFISGYLVTGSWFRCKNIWTFLRRRILRIYPGFIMASLFSAFIVGPLSGAEYFQQFHFLEYFYSVFFLLIPQVPAAFGPYYPTVNGAMWSISYEAVCYVSMMLFSFTLRKGVFFYVLIVGILLWVFLEKNPFLLEWLNGGRLFHFSVLKLISMVCIFFIGIAFNLYLIPKRGAYFVGSIIVLLIAAKFGSFIMAWAICGSYIIYFLANQPVKWLSFETDISYGIYLYAWPISKALIHFYPQIQVWELILFTTILDLPMAWCSWRFVERRFFVRQN